MEGGGGGDVIGWEVGWFFSSVYFSLAWTRWGSTRSNLHTLLVFGLYPFRVLWREVYSIPL